MCQIVSFCAKIRQKWLKLKGKLFKSKLPLSVAEFPAFSDKVIKVYELPDHPNNRHAVAMMVQHLKPDCVAVRPYVIARAIQKAMANQAAFEVIQQIKEQEKASAARPDAKAG